MKLLAVFAAVFVCVSATDVIWMELMSAQMVEADVAYDHEPRAAKNIPALATDLGLKDLVAFVKLAGLADTLSGEGPFTVFGPTDKAFGLLPKRFVDFLKKNVTVLGMILKYHVAAGEVLSTQLTNDMLIPSVEGSNIRINLYDVKNTTVVTASGRQVTLADQKASNGVIHEVSGVLFPAPGTITEVVSKCPIFSTLLKAVEAASLADTLAGAGPFTVFAPSDRAFKRIPKKCLAALLKNIPLLKKVLLYHVVGSTQYSAGLYCGEDVKTVQGGSVKIKKMWGHIKVNDACVVYADGTASNGVIHVINRVLWPKDMEDFCPEGSLDYNDDEEPMKEMPFIF